MNKSQKARRRERRINKRKMKKSRLSQYTNFDETFSYAALLQSSYTCEKGVKWKRKPQIFSIYRLTETYRLYKALHSRTYKKEPAYHFILHERGKTRPISGVSFRDRIVQRALCENSMIPILCNGIINDNAASQKGKGTDYARSRFVRHLNNAITKYGPDAYILQYDFKSYFQSVDSRLACLKILNVYKEYCTTEKDFNDFKSLFSAILLEESGIGLGNQTSQVTAIWFPNHIDHFIQEVLHCGLSGRYMDDGYAFFPNKKLAEKGKQQIDKLCKEIGLTLHPRKTKISPVTKETTFLKTCYKWNSKTGRINHRLCQSVLTYNRRHVHSVLNKTLSGEIDKDSLVCSIESYKGVLSRASKKQLKWYNYHIKQPVLLALANLEDKQGD